MVARTSIVRRMKKIPRASNYSDALTHHWGAQDGHAHFQGMRTLRCGHESRIVLPERGSGAVEFSCVNECTLNVEHDFIDCATFILCCLSLSCCVVSDFALPVCIALFLFMCEASCCMCTRCSCHCCAYSCASILFEFQFAFRIWLNIVLCDLSCGHVTQQETS